MPASVSRDADPSLKGVGGQPANVRSDPSVSRDADPSLKVMMTSWSGLKVVLRSVEMLTLH